MTEEAGGDGDLGFSSFCIIMAWGSIRIWLGSNKGRRDKVLRISVKSCYELCLNLGR